jgi:hypothetical protein
MRIAIQMFTLFLILLLVGCTQRIRVDDDDAGTGDDDDNDTGTGDDDTGTGDDDTGTGDDDTGTGDDDTGTGDDDSTDPIPEFTMNCLPASQQVGITWGNSTNVQLSAEIIWPDGNVEAPTNATWTVIGGFGGSVTSSGLYTTPSNHGGIGQIAVQEQGVAGLCEIEITIDGEVNDSGNPAVPGAFTSGTVQVDDSCAAQIIYPFDGSVMPGSLLPPKIQWNPNAGSNMYALSLVSDYSNLTFYTSNDYFTPEPGTWLGLTSFDPGTDVEISLVSGNWNGSSFSGNLCTPTNAVTIEASDNDLDGTVVYWAAGIGGMMRAISVGASTPTSFALPQSIPLMGCVGCHTVNLNNPSLMSYAEFSPMTPGRIVNLSNPSTVIAGPMDSLFTTLNPVGTRGIKAPMFGLGSIGGSGRVLTLIDLPSTTELGQLPATGTPAFADWSPDGTKLVYSSCSTGSTEFGAQNCDLRLMDVSGDVFTNDRMLLQQQGSDNFYYPTFSPDSQWIAFNRGGYFTGTDADGNATSGSSSYANPTARLFIISANGGDPIELTAANGVGDLTNSWPRWAPVTQDYAWLAYSSKRDYGHSGQGNSQLWITAVDLNQASLGNDPSVPPVWFTGQSLSENNLIPVWVPRIAF